MKNKTKSVYIICILIILPLTGCIQDNIKLDAIEIREYNGEDLSSIQEFRENSIKGTQFINKINYSLQISGLIEKPINYTYNQTLNTFITYKKVITLYCVEGWSVKILWEGILIEDILKKSKSTPNATAIIFHAYDGYTTSLPIDYITDNNILLAYKINNVTLPPERGWPFQLVAESKWGYKWIKWVTKLEITDNTNYLGYWERRGYSNKANLNESFFEK